MSDTDIMFDFNVEEESSYRTVGSLFSTCVDTPKLVYNYQFLAHQIRKLKVFAWRRNSYPTHLILSIGRMKLESVHVTLQVKMYVTCLHQCNFTMT